MESGYHGMRAGQTWRQSAPYRREIPYRNGRYKLLAVWDHPWVSKTLLFISAGTGTVSLVGSQDPDSWLTLHLFPSRDFHIPGYWFTSLGIYTCFLQWSWVNFSEVRILEIPDLGLHTAAGNTAKHNQKQWNANTERGKKHIYTYISMTRTIKIEKDL